MERYHSNILYYAVLPYEYGRKASTVVSLPLPKKVVIGHAAPDPDMEITEDLP